MKNGIILMIATLAALALVAGCNSGSEHEVSSAVDLPVAEVMVYKVEFAGFPSMLEVPGTVRSRQRVTIAAKVTGTISELPVVLGSRVARGDLLLTIAADEIKARVARARAQLEQAERNLKREEKLLAQQASTPEVVNDLRDKTRISRAALDEAETMLGYTRVKAPFAGVITEKMVNSGDLARAGLPLLVLEGEKDLQVLVDMPEALALAIRTGGVFTVNIPAASRKVRGRVGEISPASTPASRTVAVKIDIPAVENVRPGQFARVFVPGPVERQLRVPESALVPFGQMERLFVVRQGRAVLRLVRSGRRSGGMVEIIAGLDPGEEVITNPAGLREGQPVKVSRKQP